MNFDEKQEAACPVCGHKGQVRNFAENQHVPALAEAARRFYNLSEKAWAGVGDEARAELIDGLIEAKREMAAALLPEPATMGKPRVLITVRGGVADWVADPGVDVEIFDFDNQEADPAGTDPVPANFADLAAGTRVPVQKLS